MAADPTYTYHPPHPHAECDGHAGHDHHHHSCHHHGPRPTGGKFPWWRMLVAALLLSVAVMAASLVQVRAGLASVVTRFGNPVRVLIEPGLALRWPAPFESIIPVDLRLRTTSSGLQDVGTRDGLRIIVQAYVAWQVEPDTEHVQRFMRAVQNKPEETARQIRTLVGSALETTAASFDLAHLINTHPEQVRLTDFEAKLAEQINQQLLNTYGVSVVQVGIERLTLPSVTLSATVDRMRAERDTIAIERTAIGKRQAADIRSSAERDARVIEADALAEAARIEAQSRVDAAALYGRSYKGAPELYSLLRSLDTLGAIINPQTRVILRTDAAPFRVLVDAPQAIGELRPENPPAAGANRERADTASVTESVTGSSPWLQAIGIAFVLFYLFTLLAALRWLTTNVMEVGAGERAVVIHGGAITREQTAGLLWAWPEPIDKVVLVPSAEMVLERHVQHLQRSTQAINADTMAYDDDEGGPVSDALAGSGYLLTGDGAVVQLDVRLFYKVTDPRAYVLHHEYLLPALDRVVTRSAVVVAAARDLDTILVARPELLVRGETDASQREQLRHDLLAGINHQLADLQEKGSSLGIEALRVDIQSALPRDTLNAFNAVLTASQQAEQAVADARSDAARIIQQATQQADRSLQVASASAAERVAKAQADTATIAYLTESLRNQMEPELLMRVYRERMPGILKRAGAVTTMDADKNAPLIISGVDP